MKWGVLLNHVPLLIDLIGSLMRQASAEGDEVVLFANSRIAEINKRRLMPESAHLHSKIDWLASGGSGVSCDPDVSWRVLYPTLVRKRHVVDFSYHAASRWIRETNGFIEDALDRARPNVILSEPPANLFSMLAFHAARKRGIPYIGFMGSRLPGRIDVYDRGYTCAGYQEGFRRVDIDALDGPERQRLETLAHGFAGAAIEPSYQKYHRPLSAVGKITRYRRRQRAFAPGVEAFRRLPPAVRESDYESFAVIQNEGQRPWASFRRQVRAVFDRSGVTVPSDGKEPAYLFPLQVQPEASTSAQAPYHSDLLWTVTAVATALPFPARLLVKEHPSSVGERPRGFYRRLAGIPNVIVVDTGASNQDLIRRVDGVITLTSTLGFEAAFAGKPVFLLGEVFYAHHPMCRTIASLADLERALLEPPRLASDQLHDANVRFVASYERHTLPGDFGSAALGSDRNDYTTMLRSLRMLVAEPAGTRG